MVLHIIEYFIYLPALRVRLFLTNLRKNAAIKLFQYMYQDQRISKKILSSQR